MFAGAGHAAGKALRHEGSQRGLDYRTARHRPGQIELGGRVDDHLINGPQEPAHQQRVEPSPLMGQHVVADDRRHGPAPPQDHDHRQLRRNLERGHVREHHQIRGAEPPRLTNPGVGPAPTHPASRLVERAELGCVDFLPAGIEPIGILARPGNNLHVVTGGRQPPGQHRGVLRDAPFEGVSRPDDGNLHRQTIGDRSAVIGCTSGRVDRPPGTISLR